MKILFRCHDLAPVIKVQLNGVAAAGWRVLEVDAQGLGVVTDDLDLTPAEWTGERIGRWEVAGRGQLVGIPDLASIQKLIEDSDGGISIPGDLHRIQCDGLHGVVGQVNGQRVALLCQAARHDLRIRTDGVTDGRIRHYRSEGGGR